MNDTKIYPPYVDNVKAVLITIVINLGIVFLFNWPEGITFVGVLQDSMICAVVTTVIDMFIVYTSLKKAKSRGYFTTQVPESKFIQKLPRNPIALGLVYAIVFGALTVGINMIILWFFNMESMAFWPWMIYKLVYATILSIKITEYCIFRYVQPDCSDRLKGPNNKQQIPVEKPVKNPLPKVSMLKEIYGSITLNILLNIVIGSALGGIILSEEGFVIISPSTVQTIPITGFIFGLICGVLVTRGVLNEMNPLILKSASDTGGNMPARKRRYAWMPKRKVTLMCLVCLFNMIFSAFLLWGIMTIYGISIMNFYQVNILITAYAIIMSKLLSHVLVQRCLQPDYILYILRKAK